MEPPSTYRILILNDSGRRLRTEPIKAVLRFALSELRFDTGELSVRLAKNEVIRTLNREYRGIDETTDVLTFPAEKAFPTRSKRPLGDIAISVEQGERQAMARGISLLEELSYLALHGVLHLNGLEDETDDERELMLSEMDRLGTRFGLPKVEDWHTMSAGAKR